MVGYKHQLPCKQWQSQEFFMAEAGMATGINETRITFFFTVGMDLREKNSIKFEKSRTKIKKRLKVALSLHANIGHSLFTFTLNFHAKIGLTFFTFNTVSKISYKKETRQLKWNEESTK